MVVVVDDDDDDDDDDDLWGPSREGDTCSLVLLK